MIQMKTRFVDDKQYMCLKRFGSQNIKHINRASGSCNKVSLFFQGVAIADDDRRIKGDVNVYRSHVKIIAYNAHGHKVRISFNDNIFSAFKV